MFKWLKEILSVKNWDLKSVSASPRKLFLIKQIKIFTLAIRGFTEDRVQLRASALTYYTMLSIVPVAAMAFGIAKGFGFDQKLQEIITDTFSSQQEIANAVLNFADKYLLNIRGGTIAGIGVAILLWTVMRLLSNIELSFNDIWQIKKSRHMSRKLSDYISLVVIAPILIVAAIGINVFLEKELGNSGEEIPLLGYISPFLGFVIKLMPYVFIWLVFMLIYLIMPNTKVNISSALIGGIIGGTFFQLLNWGYINFQAQLTSYGAVYGSFAALPLFLMWLQLSWLIVLFGAEVSFANQNVGHYEAESETYNISHHMKKVVSLLVVKQIVTNFKESVPPMTAEDLANKLDLPVRLMRDIIYELLEVGIISETITKNVKENAYQPAIDINKLSVSYIIKLLDTRGHDSISTDNVKEINMIKNLVDSFQGEMDKAKSNKLIAEV